MTYNLVAFEQWVERSKPILESMGMDARVYKITSFVFVILGALIPAIVPQYWLGALLPLAIASVFFYKSRVELHTILVHFIIKEKQVYEMADDLAGQQLETTYSYQYVLTTSNAKQVKISPKGINKGSMKSFEQIVLTKDLFSLLQPGDVVDVLIGADELLYAINYRGRIDDVTQKVFVNGRELNMKTSVHQRITNFGTRVR